MAFTDVPMDDTTVAAKPAAVKKGNKAGSVDIPAMPDKRIKWEIAEREWFPKLKPFDWELLTFYLYRQSPRLVSRDAEKFVGDGGRDPNFNREYIKATRGGGDYEIWANQGSSNLGRISLSIPLTEADPILDISKLDITHKDNVGYVSTLKAKGILMADGTLKPKETSGDLTGLIEKLADKAMRPTTTDPATNTVVATLVEQMAKNQLSPVELMNMAKGDSGIVTALITALPALLSSLKGDSGGGNIEMMRFMMESQKQQMSFMMETAKQQHEALLAGLKSISSNNQASAVPAASGESSLDEIERFSRMAKALGFERNRATADVVVEKLPELINPVLGTLQAGFQAYTAKAQLAQQSGVPAQVQMQTAAPQQQGQPNQATGTQQQQDPAMLERTKHRMAMQAQALTLIREFNEASTQSEGPEDLLPYRHAGANLAHTVKTLQGMDTQQSIAMLGVDYLLSVMAEVSSIQTAMQGKTAEWRAFVGEFCAYPNNDIPDE